MFNKWSVSLNGEDLGSLDRRIMVQGIAERAGIMQTVAQQKGSGKGQHIGSTNRQYVDVTVSFNFYGVGRGSEEERARLFDMVVGWAACGGWLMSNFRSGKRINVICQTLPEPGDFRSDWSKDYSVVFRAYEVPYWQDVATTAVQIGRTHSGSVSVTGEHSADSPIGFTAKNLNSSIMNTLTVTANGKSMSFSGLGLGYNDMLQVDYTEDGVQRIRKISAGGNVMTAMGARTAASADDLWFKHGSNSISYSAEQNCELLLQIVRRWA